MQGRVSAHYPQDRHAYQLPHSADAARYKLPFAWSAIGADSSATHYNFEKRLKLD